MSASTRTKRSRNDEDSHGRAKEHGRRQPGRLGNGNTMRTRTEAAVHSSGVPDSRFSRRFGDSFKGLATVHARLFGVTPIRHLRKRTNHAIRSDGEKL